MYAFILIVLCFAAAAYLNNALSYSIGSVVGVEQSLTDVASPMRYLTSKTVRVAKNYEPPPAQWGTSRYNVQTAIVNEKVNLVYQFPLIGKEKSIFSTDLIPSTVSSIVDRFGVKSAFIENEPEGVLFRVPLDPVERHQFESDLREGAWVINDHGDVEVEYAKLLWDSRELVKPIAAHVVNELTRLGRDGYFNRVQAVLNFVQFIPYGQPNFDHQDFSYFGVSLPPESLVLNYSDCDSKSLLFATILSHLIDEKNIVLVLCNVTSKEDKPERHMMVGVKGLGISGGRTVVFNRSDFLLLETTQPSAIGSWDWKTFDLESVIPMTNGLSQ
jgi:hypothetical protein